MLADAKEPGSHLVSAVKALVLICFVAQLQKYRWWFGYNFVAPQTANALSWSNKYGRRRREEEELMSRHACHYVIGDGAQARWGCTASLDWIVPLSNPTQPRILSLQPPCLVFHPNPSWPSVFDLVLSLADAHGECSIPTFFVVPFPSPFRALYGNKLQKSDRCRAMGRLISERRQSCSRTLDQEGLRHCSTL